MTSGTGTPGAQQTQSDVLPDVLGGEWTPERVLYLARAEEIHALCELMNGMPAFLARLTTAETERDKALGQLHYVPEHWRYAGQLHAAQDDARVWKDTAAVVTLAAQAAATRVEALSEALRQIAELEQSGYESVAAHHFGQAQRLARAALACPPQQRGEK